ncbi:hypothetical protein [Rhodopseudomonas palustris]|uniref:Uncharacterized protein n=1 Tax=Rhodopseudomonas palustris (strain BisB18) TaxID=316056 RepID=Q211B0_RHOPB
MQYFHVFATWALRLAIVAGVIGFGSLYLMRNTSVFGPAAPSSEAATEPAATSLAPAAADADDRFPPCQPIGRTARGELVFSMDCQRGAAAAAAASNGDGK